LTHLSASLTVVLQYKLKKKFMKKTRIAINGFGRIGRVFCRQAFEDPNLEVVAINDPHPHAASCHLLKYDSTNIPVGTSCL